jgi:Protein of unknown function (DUF2865)
MARHPGTGTVARVRHTVSAWIAGAALVALSGAAVAQDYQLCVKLEARLLQLDRSQPDGSRAEIHRYNGQIMEQQRMLTAARRQAARAGCNKQGGFLLFRAPRPTGCGEFDVAITRLEANVRRLQSKRKEVMPARAEYDTGERRRILSMLGDNKCGPQYARYATRNDSGLFGMFLRDYTRDPYMTEQNGMGFYGTYRTLCVRTCDGFFWPISFSTVQTHFGYDEKLCQSSCPTSDVALYVHRNPGESPEEAMSLAGQPLSQLPNAFLYRRKFVDDCSCKAEIQTAALGDRVAVDLAARDGALLPNRQIETRAVPEIETLPIPVPRSRPGNEPPIAGSIATVTGMEDFYAVHAPTVNRVAGKDVRVVGPGFTLYRSGGE